MRIAFTRIPEPELDEIIPRRERRLRPLPSLRCINLLRAVESGGDERKF